MAVLRALLRPAAKEPSSTVRIFRIQSDSWGLMALGMFFAIGSGGVINVAFYFMLKLFIAMGYCESPEVLGAMGISYTCGDLT